MASTANLGDSSSEDPFEAWRLSVSTTFVPLEVQRLAGERFKGDLVTCSAGLVDICDVVGGPVQVDRTAATIRCSDPGYLKLGVQMRGYCVLEQDGREAALTPGDMTLYDTARPYTLRFEQNFRMLVLMFDRQDLRLNVRNLRQTTAQRISGRNGPGAMVSPFLMAVARQMHTGAFRPSVDLSESILSLIAAALSDQDEKTFLASPEVQRRALVVKIKAFMDARLGDPELSQAQIAHAHHISTRYLQKLFEGEGTTPMRWVRGRRLERARHDLANPRYSSHPISVVAGRWGIEDASYFSKLFRETFGQTPREFRKGS